MSLSVSEIRKTTVKTQDATDALGPPLGQAAIRDGEEMDALCTLGASAICGLQPCSLQYQEPIGRHYCRLQWGLLQSCTNNSVVIRIDMDG